MDLETRLSYGPRDDSHMDLETRLSYGARDEALIWS